MIAIPRKPARWHQLDRGLVLILLFIFITPGCSSKGPELDLLTHDAVILAFGDSLTYGTGASDDESYPYILEQLAGHTVINAGVPGEVSASGAVRLPDLLDAHEPELLLLCHGGNDMLRKNDGRQMLENLRTMIRAAQSRGVQVVLIAVPRPALFLSSADAYEQLAREFAIPIENDIIADILSDHSLKSDAIHPNGKGYHELAKAVHTLLRKQGAL